MPDVSVEVLAGVTQRVVDLYTREGFLFTALDVSNAVKQTLPSVRHREVSPLVRELFAQKMMGERYRQTLIDVLADRKTVQAFLYHLAGADLVKGYDEERRRQLAIPPVSASLDEEDDDDLTAKGLAANDEVQLELGADGRLRVPRALLKRAGITSPSVKAEFVGDELLIGFLLPGVPAPSGVTVIELVHPSLLQIPASLAERFDGSAAIRVRVERMHLRISGKPAAPST